PSDPAWDPDDARYNVIRWITEAHEGGFAEAQIVWDPRTGEILRGGIIIDSDLVHYGALLLRARTFPSAERSDSSQLGHNDGAPMAEQFAFGVFAQALLTGQDPSKIAGRQIPDMLFGLVMHEVGHDFGLAHNFIAHNAYTEKELRQKSFTSKNGISASVMDYIPFNIAPKNAANGDLFQTVLGPYDYHAIAWGYGRVPGAVAPEDEVPALDRMAAKWSDPRYRFASDEDVDWAQGHAIDPRVAQFVLSNDAVGWCQGQMRIVGDLMDTLDARFPATQHPWEEERAAFGYILGTYARCAIDATHFIGGEYLSRARRGDPHAALPLTPVSRSDEMRAFGVLDRYVFSNAAWKYSPLTLRRLVYSEHEALPFGRDRDNPPRHDVSVSDVAARVQDTILGYLFSPLVMARIADLPMKAQPGKTMTIADLFMWSQNAIYGEVGDPHAAVAATVRRNLQRRYARLLAKIAVSPAKGTPFDAQALARFELDDIVGRTDRALRQTHDLQLRAHLEALRADARRALSGRMPAAPA
ncbi:MAG: zinc-dependent metalloprotease, partial [Vulcanimicrobiaceae bacterium]